MPWPKSDTLILRSLEPLPAWASGKTQRGPKCEREKETKRRYIERIDLVWRGGVKGCHFLQVWGWKTGPAALWSYLDFFFLTPLTRAAQRGKVWVHSDTPAGILIDTPGGEALRFSSPFAPGPLALPST